MRMIRSGEAEVAVVGGAEGSIDPSAPSGGYYVKPVLFGSVNPDAAIAQEEVFGPVLTLFPFDTEADAIKLAIVAGSVLSAAAGVAVLALAARGKAAA